MLLHFIGEKTEIRRTAIISLQSYPFTISETLKDAALQQELPTDPERAAHLPAPMTSLLLFSVLLTVCTTFSHSPSICCTNRPYHILQPVEQCSACKGWRAPAPTHTHVSLKGGNVTLETCFSSPPRAQPWEHRGLSTLEWGTAPWGQGAVCTKADDWLIHPDLSRFLKAGSFWCRAENSPLPHCVPVLEGGGFG